MILALNLIIIQILLSTVTALTELKKEKDVNHKFIRSIKDILHLNLNESETDDATESYVELSNRLHEESSDSLQLRKQEEDSREMVDLMDPRNVQNWSPNRWLKSNIETHTTSTQLPTNHSTEDCFSEDSEEIPIARSLKKVIMKEGAKYCQKACKDSLKNVCTTHSCSRKMKKSFKKDCKLYCKNEFSNK